MYDFYNAKQILSDLCISKCNIIIFSYQVNLTTQAYTDIFKWIETYLNMHVDTQHNGQISIL